MAAPTNSVLYFPSIEFADDAWAKAALVLWDVIYRIVPSGYSPADSDEIKRAIDAGVIRNVMLDDAERKDARRAYKRFIQSRTPLPHGLQKDTESHLLHPDKIDGRLYSKLEKQARHVFHDGRLELPVGLARGYMYYLSQSVAGRRNLCRGTDDRDSWTVAAYFSEDGNFSENVYSQDAEVYFSSLGIHDLVPTSIRSVPMQSILDFVRTKEAEKQEFRLALHALSEGIAGVQNAEHRQQVLSDFTKTVENKIEALRKATKDFCPAAETGALLVVGLPTTLTALSALAPAGGSPYDLWKLGTSMLIGAVSAYAISWQVKNQNRQPSLESYLIDLDDKMARKKKFPSFHRAFEEFMND